MENKPTYLSQLADSLSQATQEADAVRNTYLQREFERRQALAQMAQQGINPSEEVEEKKKALKDAFNRGRLDLHDLDSAITNDVTLNAIYGEDNAKRALIQEIAGLSASQGTSGFDIMNKKIAYEDNPENNVIGRNIVGTLRGAERTIKSGLSSINNGLGALGITEGSYAHKRKELDEQINRLPREEIEALKTKMKLSSDLNERLNDIDRQIMLTKSPVELEDLYKEKLNLQKIIEKNNILSENEQRLIDSGDLDSYDRAQSKISALNASEAYYQGSSIFSDVNDMESFHKWRMGEESRLLEQKYKNEGVDLNNPFVDIAGYLRYQVENQKHKLVEGGIGDMSAEIGAMLPYLAMMFIPGTQGLTAGALARIGGTYAFGSSDAYTRYCEAISSQLEKDPRNVDKIRAALGAVTSEVMDLAGSKLAIDVPKDTVKKMLTGMNNMTEGMLKAYSEANKLGFNASRSQILASMKAGGELGLRDATISAEKAMGKITKELNAVEGPKVLNTLKKLSNAPVEAAKKVGTLANKAKVPEALKAGAYLGFENAGSDLATQYAGGTDLKDVDWNQVANSALDGLTTGSIFHYVGMGIHGGKAAIDKMRGDKKALNPQNEKQMKDILSGLDSGKFTSEQGKQMATFMSESKTELESQKNKLDEAIKDIPHTIDGEGKVLPTSDTTKAQQKILDDYNKNYEGLTELIKKHEANIKAINDKIYAKDKSEVKEALQEDGTAIFNDSEMDNISKKFKAFNEDIQTDLLKEQGYTEEQAQNVLKRLNAKDEDILSDKDLGFKEGVDNALFEMNVDSTVAQGVSEEVQDAIISQDANKLKEAITNSMGKDKDSEEYKATDRLQKALKANAGFDYTSDKPTLMKDSLVDYGNTKGNRDVYENLLSEVRKEEGFKKSGEDLSKVSDEELVNKFKAKPSTEKAEEIETSEDEELTKNEAKIKRYDYIAQILQERLKYLKDNSGASSFLDTDPDESYEDLMEIIDSGYLRGFIESREDVDSIDGVNKILSAIQADKAQTESAIKEKEDKAQQAKEASKKEADIKQQLPLVQELAARYALDSASRNYANTNKLEDLESTPEQAINYVEEKLGEKLNDELKDAIRDLYNEEGVGINSYLTAGFSEYNRYHSYKKYDTEAKAQEAIKKNGLEDTHEVVKLYGGKYIIDEKLKNAVNDPLFNLVDKVSKDLKDGNQVNFSEVKEELKKAIQDSNITLLKDNKFLSSLDNLNKDKWSKVEAAVGLAVNDMQKSSKVSSKNNLKEGKPEGNPQYKHNYTYARNRANITRKKIAQKQFNSMAGSEPTLYKKVPWLKAITDVPTLRRVAFTNLMNIANASGNTVLDVLTSEAMQDAIKDDKSKINNLLQDFNLPATSVDDIETLLTHVKMLANSGLANPSELENLRATLSLLQQLIKKGHFKTSNNSSLGNLLWEKQTSEHDTEKFITKTTALTANINALADKFGIKKEKLEYTCADVDGMLGKIIKGLSPIGDMQLFVNSLKGINKLLSNFKKFDEIAFDKNFNIIFRNSTILELLQAEANNTNNEALKLLIDNKGDMSQFTSGNRVQALSAFLTSKTIQSLFYGLANTDRNSFNRQLDTIQANSIRILPIDSIEDFHSKSTSTGKSVSENLNALATSLGIKKGTDEYRSFSIFMLNSMKDNGFITESIAGHRILQLAIENEHSVDKVKTDYFNPDILDNLDAINSGNIEQYLKRPKDIQYVREHYGNIIFNMALKVLKDRVHSKTSKGIDRDADIARALRLWSKSLEVKGKVLEFNTHEQLTKPEVFTGKEILDAVNNFIIPHLKDSDSLNLAEELGLSGSTDSNLNQAYKFLNLKAGQNNVATLGKLNQEQLNDLGTKIYDYINTKKIPTSYEAPTTKGSVTGKGVTPKPSRSNPLKHIADTSGSMYNISKAFKRPSLVATNSIDLAINAYSNNANVSSGLTFIKDMADRMSLDFMSVRAVDPDSSPIDSLFSYSFNGRRIMAHEYANVVATVALNNLSDASKPMDPDGDFYKKLVASTSHATGQYFLQNNIVNRTEFFNNMGKSIIKSMGLSRSVLGDSMYNAMVVQAGIDAAIMLNREGLIDIEYISTSPVKGRIDIRNVNEGPQVGYIAGIKLKTGNSLVDKVRDNVNKCKVKDGGTTKYVLDECLGIDFHSRDKTYTAAEYTTEQKKYADEFGDKFSEYQKSKLIQVNEDGLMRINTSGDESKPDYVYFTEDQYLKDDDTYVEPNRLVELALQQKAGWTHNNDLAEKVYDDCSILDTMSEAEIDTAIEAIDSWGEAGTLYEDERWGRLKSFIRYEDPKEYTQIYAQNVHSKNVSAAKQFFRNYAWYKENKEALKQDSKVYNKLTNTKNNRFYIPGQDSNRREDKYFGRPLFYAQTCSIDLNNQDEVFLAKSTILSNLETKYDKMSRNELDTAWDSIIADENFQDIFKAYKNKGDVYAAINKFNDKKFIYTVANKDKVLEIAYDATTLSTLEALTNELKVNDLTFGESKDNTEIKTFLSFKSGPITEWRLAMEVDGLNNGSAWKNLMSNSLVNAQEGSLLAKARAIAGGISTDYDTFVEATAEGNVDAYNLNGRSARFNAIHKFVASAVMQDEYKNIVSLLGVVFDKNQDQMVELLSEILDRDMMKYPTMYFTYGAGFKALIANMSNIMSKQTSHFLATANKEQLRDYFDKLFLANNGNPVKVSYYDPKTGAYTDGYIKAEDASVSFSSGLSLLDPEVRKNSNIFFEDNKSLTSSLEGDIITPLWDGFNESSEGMRDTVKTSTEVSNVLAQVYNSKVADIITEVYNDNHGVLNLADLDARLDKLNESFDSVLNIGEDKTTLQLLKQDIKNDTKKLFSILTKQYGSKAIVKGDVETIMKSNLGAGEDPMTIHTMDNNTMTHFQTLLRGRGLGEVLPIHDATYLTPEQILKGGSDINKVFFRDAMLFPITLKNRNDLLTRVISQLNANTFGLSNTDSLLAQADRVYNRANDELHDMIALRLEAINNLLNTITEDGEDAKATLNVNQYQFLGFTNYQPTRKDLQDIKDKLIELGCANESLTVDKAISWVSTNAIKHLNPDQLRSINNNKSPTNGSIILDSDIVKSVNTMEELMKKIEERTGVDLTSYYRDYLAETANELLSIYNQEMGLANEEEVDPLAINNSIDNLKKETATNKAEAIRGVYNALGTAVNYAVVNKEHIRHQFTSSVNHMRSLLSDQPTQLESLLLMHNACNTNKELTEDRAFLDLYREIFNDIRPIQFSTEVDTARNTVFYEDSGEVSYSGLRNFINKNIQQAKIHNTEHSANMNQKAVVLHHFNQIRRSVQNDINSALSNKNEKKVQLVFTLRTKMDILKMQAASQLINEISEYKDKVSIVVIPGMTDMVTAGVNRNTQINETIKDRLTTQNGKDKNASVLIKSVTIAPNKYKDLSAIGTSLGTPMTKEYIDSGTRAGKYESYIINLKSEPVDEKIESTNLKPCTRSTQRNRTSPVVIHRTNEFGVNMGNNGTRIDLMNRFNLNLLDLETTPLSNRELTSTIYSDIFELTPDDLEARFYEEGAAIRVEDAQRNSIDVNNNFSSLLETNNVLLIDTVSDGTIKDRKLASILNNTDITKELVTKYQAEYKARQARYANQAISWDEAISPIYVEVPNNTLNGTIKAVFQTTLDISISPRDLGTESFQFDRVTNRLLNFTPGSELARFGDFNKLKQLHKFGTTKYTMDTTRRINIPQDMINKDLLNTDAVSGRLDSNLHMTNQLAVEQLVGNRHLDVIKFSPSFGVDSLEHNDQGQLTHITGSKSYTTRIAYTGNIPLNNATTIAREANKSFAGRTKDLINNATRRFMGWHNYRGDYTGSKNPNAEKYNDMSNRDMETHINRLITLDKARGIDNSHLDSLIPLFTNLAMKVNLVVNREIGRNGGEGLTWDHANRQKYVSIEHGIISNGVGSNLELLFHELVHGICEHLNMDPTATKQATQLYTYVASHITPEHFTDCSKQEAEELINYIFNSKDVDHIAEFLAYAMTNKSFQNAINNMGINGQDALPIFSRTKGVVSRVLGTFTKFLGKNNNEIPNSILDGVFNVFNITYENSQKVWEDVRKEDLLSDEEYIEKLATLNEPMYKVFKQGANIISSTISNITDSSRVTGSITNPDMSTEQRHASEVVPLLTDMANKLIEAKTGFLPELMTSLSAVSHKNWEYIKLRQLAKKAIDTNREQASSVVNNFVKDTISHLDPKVQNALTKHFVKADVSCLFDNIEPSERTMSLLTDPKARKEKIKSLEHHLRSLNYGKYYVNASKGLADYIVKGVNTSGLGYKNAYEVANLSGTPQQTDLSEQHDTVRTIDKLTTLYAMDMLDAEDPSVYKALDLETVEALSTLHNSIKQSEFDNVYFASNQRHHIPKGQLHGGKPIGSYKIYPMKSKEAVDWSKPTSVTKTKLDPFYKDIMKEDGYITAHHRWRSPIPIDAGIFAMTDVTMGRVAGGVRVGSNSVSNILQREPEVQRISQYLTKRVLNLNSDKPSFLKPDSVDGGIVPKFNHSDKLIGSDFELNPNVVDEKIGRNVKVTSVFGDLYGSVIERSSSKDVNIKAAQAVEKIYQDSKDKGDFVFVNDLSEDANIREYYSNLPFEVKNYFEARKYEGVPVRKIALDIAFGKSTPSSKKVDEEYYNLVRQGIAKVSDRVKHVLHHGYVANTEEAINWLVKTGKDNIVIKGLSVSINNILSNTILLGLSGLSPVEAMRGQVEAMDQLRELETLQNRMDTFNLKRLNKTYTDQDFKLEKATRESLKALPIYPLYEKGILGTIAEDLQESDRFLKDLIDKYATNTKLNSLAHFVGNTPKSVIYKMLRDLATYGDKTAKYAMYKNLPDTLSEDEKLRQVTSTFIDYGIPLPTGLDLIESLGISNFLKYGLGIQSVIANTLTRKPEKALTYLLAQSALGVNLPDTFDSLLGINSIMRGANVPGIGIFMDSISALPTARVANAVTDLI